MKGFDLEIKNNLLEPKHVQNMGTAIWLYMWLIDKVTSISEEGVGKVLGGKPITFNEVEAELGISADQYTAWVKKLRSYPYIIAIRTPHGVSFRVLKAHKRFKVRPRTMREAGIPCEWCSAVDMPLQKHHYPVAARNGGTKTVLICTVCHTLYHSTSLPPENPIYRKTAEARSDSVFPSRDSDKSQNVRDSEKGPNVIRHNSLDKNRKDTPAQDAEEKQKNKDIAEMIDLFKMVNPAHGRLFQMNPQRQAAERLLKMKDLAGWMKFMETFAVKMQTDPYCPKATTPSQLESKLGAIIAYGNSLKTKELSGTGKGRGFA